MNILKSLLRPRTQANVAEIDAPPHPLEGWLRAVGMTEGVSFLLLLFIATPLKRLAGEDVLVHILGPIHGGLFLLYVALALLAARVFRWNWQRVGLALLASVFPFGPFVFEAYLRRQ